MAACSLRASQFIVTKARDYLQERGKRLLVLLSYSATQVAGACEDRRRFDQSLVDFLEDGGFLFADTLRKHVEDYASFACSPQEYAARFYVRNHYNPMGNHFFAFAVKNQLVDWLDPKPPTYREGGPSL